MTVKTEKLLQFGSSSTIFIFVQIKEWRHATAWGKELNILTHHLVNVSVMFCFVLMMKSKNAASARNIPSSLSPSPSHAAKMKISCRMMINADSRPIPSHHMSYTCTISGGYVNGSFNIWVAMLPCAGGCTESKEYAIKWQGCSVTGIKISWGINITWGINISWGINITTSSSLLFTAP